MSHEYQDRVSMELARRIAAELPHRPDWLTHARNNLRRWSERNHDAEGLLRCYEEWRLILERPVEEVVAILTAPTDEGQRLRQNSPLAGIIPPREVWDIKRRLRHETRAA